MCKSFLGLSGEILAVLKAKIQFVLTYRELRFCCGLLLNGGMFILEAGSVTEPDNFLSGHTNVQCKIS